MSALATTDKQAFSLVPTNLTDAMRFAEIIAKSDMVPKDYKERPGNVMVAMQMGMELGLPPLQAIQNIAVINGRPSVWGDIALAIVKARPDCEDVEEFFEGEGDKLTAVCVVKRKGKKPVRQTFSIQDAKDAKLLDKDGPWKLYRRRMLQMRARAFGLRDAFPDALKGLQIAEEAQDIKDMGPADVVIPAYPEDAFEKNLPAWLEAIKAGARTADQIIDMVSTKGALTEDQKAKIKGTYQEPQA